MAMLTIRNVTVNPIELILVERFESSPQPGGFFTNIFRIITGLFIAASKLATATATANPFPTEDQEPHDRRYVTGVVVGPFETKTTDIRAAGPGREMLRLTFQTPGTTYQYVVALRGGPAHCAKAVVAKAPGQAPLDLTAVYTPAGAQLALFGPAALPRWMARLRDELPLSALSIPGTHNSPACHVALPSVRCQAVGVRAQLDHGVRFLDVRVGCSRSGGDDDLPLVHGAFPVALAGARSLAGLLADVYAFLAANPSETVLLSLKREGTGRGTDRHLSRHLHARYVGAAAAARRWFTEPRIPLLGEARGRIVLIRRFHLDASLHGEHGGRGWGLDAAAWPDNCADAPTGSGLIRVQDFYEVGRSTNIDKKIALARAQLERACQQQFAEFAVCAPTPGVPPLLPFFVNFLSASNFFNASCWPEKIAAKVNPSIVEYLCIRHAEKGKGPAQLDVGHAGTGIVVTDWVGQDGDWDLIKCIVGWNARLQLK